MPIQREFNHPCLESIRSDVCSGVYIGNPNSFVVVVENDDSGVVESEILPTNNTAPRRNSDCRRHQQRQKFNSRRDLILMAPWSLHMWTTSPNGRRQQDWETPTRTTQDVGCGFTAHNADQPVRQGNDYTENHTVGKSTAWAIQRELERPMAHSVEFEAGSYTSQRSIA